MLLLAASVSLVPFAAAAEDAVIARVNGVEIKQSDLDFAASEVGPRLGSFRPDDRQRVLLQFVIENELMAAAGEKDKLNKADNFDARVKYHTRRALRDAYFDSSITGAVKDADAKKIYDEATLDTAGYATFHDRSVIVTIFNGIPDLEEVGFLF